MLLILVALLGLSLGGCKKEEPAPPAEPMPGMMEENEEAVEEAAEEAEEAADETM
jgi:hypothetical protein